MATLTKEQKIEWSKAKRVELENQLQSFLSEAIETKEGMDKLTAHYRISGTYSYSFHNSMLIMLQGGSICQSKSNWEKLERKVESYDKKIYILCPILIDEKVNGVATDKKICIGFKPARTYDVSQTDGKALEYDHNSDEVMDIPYDRVSKVLSKLTGAEVKEEATGPSRGYCDGKKLVVSEFSNDCDKTKTLIHETAHFLTHFKKDEKVSREAMEVEAESVAYLVISYLGLDYELSKNYVNSYKSGIKDARCSLIIKTADRIIKSLKKAMSDEEKFLVALS